MGVADYEQVPVTSRAELRAWLEQNVDRQEGVWLVLNKRTSGLPFPSYDEIVMEALCFGWIDSTVRSLDETRSLMLFTPRKPTSTWSATNKQRLEILLPSGLMRPRGLAAIDAAKANGSWDSSPRQSNLRYPRT